MYELSAVLPSSGYFLTWRGQGLPKARTQEGIQKTTEDRDCGKEDENSTNQMWFQLSFKGVNGDAAFKGFLDGIPLLRATYLRVKLTKIWRKLEGTRSHFFFSPFSYKRHSPTKRLEYGMLREKEGVWLCTQRKAAWSAVEDVAVLVPCQSSGWVSCGSRKVLVCTRGPGFEGETVYSLSEIIMRYALSLFIRTFLEEKLGWKCQNK